jgi:colanic acid biosynthesis glycosyl transferase WcaI
VRILIHGLNFSPELVGVGKYTGEMAEWLARRGHEVRAVTAPPFNPAWKVAAGFSAWRYALFTPDNRREPAAGGLTVMRCPLWVPEHPSAAKRILHLASFALSSFPAMLRQSFWKPDVVLVIEPTLLCLPAAWVAARISGGKTWLHIQDFEADAGFELGLLKSALLRRIVARLEKGSMGGFDRVSTISQKMLGKLAGKKIAQSACRLFPNWVDTNKVFPSQKPSSLRQELGISNRDVVALYAGTMARKQGLEVLAESALRLAGRQDLRFVFCGEGPGKAALAELSGRLANVHWIPLQPFECLNELLNLADIHLLPQKADAADLVMPSKLTGMLASGRPVVAAARPGTQLAEVVAGRGIVVEPENPAAFCGAIERLAENPCLREKLGNNARQYAVSELAKEKILCQFERDLTLLASGS